MRLTYLLPLALLPACASMTTGTSQSVRVETAPPGAACTLKNERGEWHLNATPGSATVQRSSSALDVTCRKGKLSGRASLEPTTEGNALAGGLIGAVVDMSSGAAYAYPGTITVTLGGKQ